MNATLNRTDVPFGKVVQLLHFCRTTLGARLLWSPLPEGWELSLPAPFRPEKLVIPHSLLRHQAVLAAADGHTFSLVVETYTNEVLVWSHDVLPRRPETKKLSDPFFVPVLEMRR